MKRRVANYVMSACVAGAVATSGGAIVSGQAMAAEPTPPGYVSIGDIDMNVVLYGPPSVFIEPGREPSQDLYGPPPVIDRKANPMAVSVATTTFKASRLVNKARTTARAIAVSKAAGKVTYEKIAKNSSKRLLVDKKTGAVTVRKGTKAGVYKMRVSVKAQGTSRYLPASKVVTVKVHVK